MMSTPIETAAEALWMNVATRLGGVSERVAKSAWDVTGGRDADYMEDASAVLASLAQHRDDIAQVLADHTVVDAGVGALCECGDWSGSWSMNSHEAHQADAVLAYLTGEKS